MQEKTLEKRFVTAVKTMGGIAPKLTSPGFDGMPDRLVLLPNGKVGFVELKAPGKKPRPIQTRRIEQLKNLGFKVYVLDNTDEIEVIINDIQSP